MNFGGDNVIAVKVDNSNDYKEEATGAGYQWMGRDFNPNYGGLNHDVWLHLTGKVYQTLPLYENLQTTGIYIYPSHFSIPDKTCDVTVEAQVRNESGDQQAITFRRWWWMPTGVVARQFDGDTSDLVAGQTEIFTATGSLAAARFWDVNDPYLYDVYSILTVNGKVVDVCKTRTGFRKAEFKGGAGTGGVWLNGHFVWLTGYSQRSADDWAGLGQAYPDWMHDFNAHLCAAATPITSAGCTFRRSAWMSRACDKVGDRRSLPGGRQGKGRAGPPMGSAHRSHARLDDFFSQQPQHPFLGGGQHHRHRRPDAANGGPAQAMGSRWRAGHGHARQQRRRRRTPP